MDPAALFLALALAITLPAQPAVEVIADLQVHGNVVTPDDEILRLTGVQIGEPLDSGTVDAVASRLRASKRFQRVEVLKRFASIADPSHIVLVVIVDEGPVRIETTGDGNQPARIVRNRRVNLMFLPVLRYEDGYGVSYGVRFAAPNGAGKGGRVSVPLTWGGDKRAAIELTKDLGTGPLSRAEAGTSISRRTHPFYQEHENRGRVWARATRDLHASLKVSVAAGWQHVSFRGIDDSFLEAGPEVVFDTRLDPILARNAVYLRGGWSHLAFRNGDAAGRSSLEGIGYLGLLGQTVLVVRAQRDAAKRALPLYLQPILGGTDNLRGFRAGTAVGDTLVAGSAELRTPLTSPLRIGKIGVSAFVDLGTVYNDGERLSDHTMKKGVGGSVWFSVAVLRFSVAVAHGIGGSTRAHVGGSLSL